MASGALSSLSINTIFSEIVICSNSLAKIWHKIKIDTHVEINKFFQPLRKKVRICYFSYEIYQKIENKFTILLYNRDQLE